MSRLIIESYWIDVQIVVYCYDNLIIKLSIPNIIKQSMKIDFFAITL